MTPVRQAALVAAFTALLVLPPIGQRQIVTGDEARFALLARDMLERGTWFDARVRTQRYRNKPLMYPWAIKLLAMPRGRVTEAMAQIPIAVAAIGAAFFTVLLGEGLFGGRAGLWGGLILATSYAFFAHSQIMLPDMIVVVFGLAALYAFWRSVTHPPGRGALVGFYGALALGVLAKGPMGLLPLAVIVVWLLTEEGVRGLRRLFSKVGVLAFLALSAAWLTPYLFAGGRSFARTVVWEDWLAWYLGGPQPAKILNMLAEDAKGLIPWTPLLVLPLLAVRREWRNGAFRFAFLAWLVPLVIVCLSTNHRIRYLLPTYAPAALMIAWWLERHGTERSRTHTVVTVLMGVGALAAIAVLVAPWVDPAERALVDGFWWKAALVLASALALGIYATWTFAARKPAWLVIGVALGMAVLFGGGVTVYNAWVNRGQDYRLFVERIERHARGGEVGVGGGRFFSVDFYLGRAVTPARTTGAAREWLARPERPLYVTTTRGWKALEEEPQGVAGIEVLDTMRVRGHVMYMVRRAERTP